MIIPGFFCEGLGSAIVKASSALMTNYTVNFGLLTVECLLSISVNLNVYNIYQLCYWVLNLRFSDPVSDKYSCDRSAVASKGFSDWSTDPRAQYSFTSDWFLGLFRVGKKPRKRKKSRLRQTHTNTHTNIHTLSLAPYHTN